VTPWSRTGVHERTGRDATGDAFGNGKKCCWARRWLQANQRRERWRSGGPLTCSGS